MIQPTTTKQITAEAGDLQTAREQLQAGAPAGTELIQIHPDRVEGRIRATGTFRQAGSSEIVADGADYDTALAALRTLVPEDQRLLSIRTN